mgnify:CR=1 FL=1|tara:strand:+ start:7214 stop:8137 length:924 start_codon:yes stop_codon:yes gene_type:complete
MTLSVVTTLYKSRRFLETFLLEILESIGKLNINDFELIFVNDGSPDDSLEYLLNRKGEIPQITVIDLSRNFGHHYAMQAGLAHSSGDFVFLIDNDLEVSPSFIITCFNTLTSNKDSDVIYGYQEIRKGRIVESLGGRLFWWAINKFSDVKIPKNIVTERLMKRRYVNNLLQLGDANLFFGGMMYWTGYNQIGIPIDKGLREGDSTYSTGKRLELMIQAITSFSGKPLEYLFYSGLLITIGSLIFIIYLVIMKFFLGDEIQLGWTSLVALNVLILGIVATFLGLIGIYLFKIFRQVQNRPNFIIREIY